MFERFTPAARAAVAHAEDEARFLGHPSVGTEHLLLGLMHDDVPTAKLLSSSGVFFLEARGVVAEVVGAEAPPRTGEVPFTPRAKKVFERALREALAEGFSETHPEHLLLAVLEEGEHAGAAVILSDLVVDLDDLRARTAAQLGGQAPGVPATAEGGEAGSAVTARVSDLVLGVAGFAIGVATGWLVWGWH